MKLEEEYSEMENKNSALFRLMFIVVMAIFAIATKAQESEIKAMHQIESNPEKYIWGYGFDVVETIAKDNAKTDLVSNIRASVSAETKSTINDEGESFSGTFNSYSASTIRNILSICYYDKKQKLYKAMCYVNRSDLAKESEYRKEMVRDFIFTGQEQEGKLNISDALKYYTWALLMLTAYQDNLSLILEGREQNAKTWLDTHISMILDNIQIQLATDKVDIDHHPDEIDKYTVNLNIKYSNENVSSLDIGYFNGLREVRPVHVKNGDAALAFEDLNGIKDISLSIIYDYPEDGEKYDELKTIYDQKYRVSFNNKHRRLLTIKIKNDNISQRKRKEEQHSDSYVTQPIIEESRTTISRPEVNDQQLTESLITIEKALRSRNYSSVKSLFTSEGWELFQRMTSLAKVRVSKTPDKYTIESTNLTTIGKGIPVTVTNDKHIANETIVFRFEPETGLIKSVAYALSKRAEDDIFRESSWSLESRYALLQFMEDYQTAFALKRLDFIQSIFSDDAVIITGKFTNRQSCKRFYEADALKTSGKNVTYTRHTKNSYLTALKRDFLNNRYIQLIFEDALISKVDTRGYGDNEIMWIEIKQHYNSSTYSDKGYLSLMIDLKPVGSQIHVRTWTPQFIEISDLKERFNIGQ